MHTIDLGKYNCRTDLVIEKKQNFSEEELVGREVVCPSCGKKMIPKLHLYMGKPSRSFCPHCGMKYQEFRNKGSYFYIVLQLVIIACVTGYIFIS